MTPHTNQVVSVEPTDKPKVFVQACREEDRKFLATEAGQQLIAAAVAKMQEPENLAMLMLRTANGSDSVVTVPYEIAVEWQKKICEGLAAAAPQQQQGADCPMCKGSGEIGGNVGQGPYAEYETVNCPECNGTGEAQQQAEPVAHVGHRSTYGIEWNTEELPPEGTPLFTQPLTADASFNQGIEAAAKACEKHEWSMAEHNRPELAEQSRQDKMAILKLKRPTDMVTMTRKEFKDLLEAAAAVITCWSSPKWKEMPYTAEYIDRLSHLVADAFEKNEAIVSRALEGKR